MASGVARDALVQDSIDNTEEPDLQTGAIESQWFTQILRRWSHGITGGYTDSAGLAPVGVRFRPSRCALSGISALGWLSVAFHSRLAVLCLCQNLLFDAPLLNRRRAGESRCWRGSK